jgi:hypothetical protein
MRKPFDIQRRMREMLVATLLSMAYHAEASATNLLSVTYEAETDLLILVIAYRGTHENHMFTIQWGECRQLDDEHFETYGLLVDSDPTEHALQDFLTKLAAFCPRVGRR